MTREHMDGSPPRGSYPFDRLTPSLDRSIQTSEQKLPVPETAPILGMQAQSPERVKTRADVMTLKRADLNVLTDQDASTDANTSRKLAVYLDAALGKTFDDRVRHLRARASKDFAFAPKFEAAVKLEFETSIKEILTVESAGQMNSVERSLQCAKIVSTASGEKKAFVAMMGRGRAFKLDAHGTLSPILDSVMEREIADQKLTRTDAEQILDAKAGGRMRGELRLEKFEYEKAKKDESRGDDVHAVAIDVVDGDRILLVSEGVAERLTTDVLQRLIHGNESATQLENEMQLNAHIRVRIDSMRSSKDIAVSVLDVGTQKAVVATDTEISSRMEEVANQLRRVQAEQVYGETRRVDYATELKKALLRQEIEGLKYASAKEKFDSATTTIEKSDAEARMKQTQAAYYEFAADVSTYKEMLKRKAESDRTANVDLARKKATTYSSSNKDTSISPSL